MIYTYHSGCDTDCDSFESEDETIFLTLRSLMPNDFDEWTDKVEILRAVTSHDPGRVILELRTLKGARKRG